MVTEIEREQRYVIDYCYRRGLTPAETYREMKNVYGKECFQLRMCEPWHKEFKDGRQSAKFLPHTSQLVSMCTATNINTISLIIREDLHQSLCKLEEQTNISQSRLHWIVCRGSTNILFSNRYISVAIYPIVLVGRSIKRGKNELYF